MKNPAWFLVALALAIVACTVSFEGASPQATAMGQPAAPTTGAPTLAITLNLIPTATGNLASTSTGALAASTSPTPEPPPGLIPKLGAGAKIQLTNIDMMDRLNGWGMGGPAGSSAEDHIFRTINGGASWKDVTPAEYANPASASAKVAVGWFTNSDIAWVTYYSSSGTPIPAAPVVWRTTDSGATWEASAPLGSSGISEKYQVSKIQFSTRYGWLLVHTGGTKGQDHVALYLTTDSGATWAQVINPASGGDIQACDKTGILFINSAHGWITGNCQGNPLAPFLFASNDGGNSWRKMAVPPPTDNPDLFTVPRYACGIQAAISVYTSETITALGLDCQPQGTTNGPHLFYRYYTMDWGASWTMGTYPGGALFYISQTAWALGRDIYLSTDNTQTWTKITSVDWDGKFDFVNAKEGWAVGTKDGSTKLYRTADSGASWTPMDPVVASQ